MTDVTSCRLMSLSVGGMLESPQMWTIVRVKLVTDEAFRRAVEAVTRSTDNDPFAQNRSVGLERLILVEVVGHVT